MLPLASLVIETPGGLSTGGNSLRPRPYDKYRLSLTRVAGLVLDQVYGLAGITPQAVIGQAAEVIPGRLEVAGAAALIILSIRPFAQIVQGWIQKLGISSQTLKTADCDCSGS